MPKYIAKLEKTGHEPRYLEWSTIVDAPVTHGMELAPFREWYAQEYGQAGLNELEPRLARADSAGTSAHTGESVADLISCNRAGPGESELTFDEIWETYCRDN